MPGIRLRAARCVVEGYAVAFFYWTKTGFRQKVNFGKVFVLNGILFEIDESFLQIIDFKQIIVQNCKAYMYLG